MDFAFDFLPLDGKEPEKQNIGKGNDNDFKAQVSMNSMNNNMQNKNDDRQIMNNNPQMVKQNLNPMVDNKNQYSQQTKKEEKLPPENAKYGVNYNQSPLVKVAIDKDEDSKYHKNVETQSQNLSNEGIVADVFKANSRKKKKLFQNVLK